MASDAPERPTFAAPWQARAFALAVALTEEDDPDRTWQAFQAELVAEIEAADRLDSSADPAALPNDEATESAYYRAWLAALEGFLTDQAVIDADRFADRAAAFAAGDRDAHEFVTGDPRDHADRLPDGHADGGGHDHGDAGHHHY